MSKKDKKRDTNEAEQYQLFDTAPYEYRVFVTNMTGTIDLLVWFYRQRAGAENLMGLSGSPHSFWLNQARCGGVLEFLLNLSGFFVLPLLVIHACL